MNRPLKLVTLLSLITLPLGTVACSNGSSPTEPGLLDLEQTTVAASTSEPTSITDAAKGRGRGRGGNNNQGTNNGKRGRGGRGKRGARGDRGGQDDAPRVGQEFESAVAAVGQGSLTLSNGTRVVVDGQTRWDARGDLHTLSQVAGAVAANRPVRAEGRGNRQADGSILALTLKAEVDD